MSKHLNAVTQLFGAAPSDGTRKDAIDLAAVSKALTFVEEELQKVQYIQAKFRQIVPVRNNIDKGTRHYDYRKADRFGIAKMIDANADDIPEVNMKVAQDSQPVKDFALAYSYNLQQLASASMAGVNLDQEDAVSCAEGLEKAMDQFIAVGDADLGIKGLLNATGVTNTNSAATWATTIASGSDGPKKVVEELLASELGMFSSSKGLFAPNLLVMSSAKFAQLSGTMLNTTGQNSDSILSAYLKASRFIRNESQIVVWEHCATAASGGGEMIAFMSVDPAGRNFLAPIPREMEVLPAQAHNLKLKTVCWVSTAGAVVKQPLALRYRDGI